MPLVTNVLEPLSDVVRRRRGVAVARHAAQVRAGARLGHRDRGDAARRGEAGQPARLLLVVGEVEQVRRDDVVLQRKLSPTDAGVGDLLVEDRVEAEVARCRGRRTPRAPRSRRSRAAAARLQNARSTIPCPPTHPCAARASRRGSAGPTRGTRCSSSKIVRRNPGDPSAELNPPFGCVAPDSAAEPLTAREIQPSASLSNSRLVDICTGADAGERRHERRRHELDVPVGEVVGHPGDALPQVHVLGREGSSQRVSRAIASSGVTTSNAGGMASGAARRSASTSTSPPLRSSVCGPPVTSARPSAP